jgi:hypothetical protein
VVGFSGAVCFDSNKTAKLDAASPYLRSVARAKLTLAILARNHGHQAGNGLSLRPVIAAPCLSLGPVWQAAKPVTLIHSNKIDQLDRWQ